MGKGEKTGDEEKQKKSTEEKCPRVSVCREVKWDSVVKSNLVVTLHWEAGKVPPKGTLTLPSESQVGASMGESACH